MYPSTAAHAMPLSAADKDQEIRLYYVVNSRLGLTPGQVATLAVQGTIGTMRAATDLQRAAYDVSLQPKVALRSKNMRRAIDTMARSGLPHAVIEAAGEPALMAIGPVTRANLPPSIMTLQLLADDPPDGTPVPLAVPPHEGLVVTIVVRSDLAIPFGKLVAQAAHGFWGVAHDLLDNQMMRSWEQAGRQVLVKRVPDLTGLHGVLVAAQAHDIRAVLIRDAGRTVFATPTETVVGVAPYWLDALPPRIRDLPAL